MICVYMVRLVIYIHGLTYTDVDVDDNNDNDADLSYYNNIVISNFKFEFTYLLFLNKGIFRERHKSIKNMMMTTTHLCSR